MKNYITEPKAIEDKSMAIIADLLHPMDLSGPNGDVIKRVVHTSGDPAIAPIIKLSPGAAEKGIQALLKGSPIFTDVNMVKTGISSKYVNALESRVECAIADPEVVELARQTGLTRAMTAFDRLAAKMNGAVVAIGNAPTALFTLLEAVEAGKCAPSLIVGTPVGFVGAAESKELLAAQDKIPYITIQGTRGGSNIAAAIVNALLINALQQALSA